MKEIGIKSNLIQLDQFLKWANIVNSGGEAKTLIQDGNILVNGEVELRRSHKLEPGDTVSISGNNETFRVIKG